jgi:hypothetical protein
MLTLMISSCASNLLASSSLAPLESRTLDICEDLKGFCWQYNKCARRIIGICTKTIIATERIDVEFKDQVQAKQLFDMNFILKVREKPL